MRKFLRIAIPVSGAVGVVVAGCALYLGFKDNSQSEFFDVQTGSVEVWHSLWFFTQDAIVATGAAFLLLGVLTLFLRFTGRWRK
jgi:NhaP-type Na+/H+ or K+/H+ antiporter